MLFKLTVWACWSVFAEYFCLAMCWMFYCVLSCPWIKWIYQLCCWTSKVNIYKGNHYAVKASWHCIAGPPSLDSEAPASHAFTSESTVCERHSKGMKGPKELKDWAANKSNSLLSDAVFPAAIPGWKNSPCRCIERCFDKAQKLLGLITLACIYKSYLVCFTRIIQNEPEYMFRLVMHPCLQWSCHDLVQYAFASLDR